MFGPTQTNSLCRNFAYALALAAALEAPLAHAQTQVSDDARPVNSRAHVRPSLLQQLESSLQELAARVSPAVVQIVVSGYRPVADNDHSETAKLARTIVIGSGIIVDPDGYIMTNARVVEGAQRIKVILAPPPVDSRVELQPIQAQQISGT
jgi:serine protease Do